MAKFTLPRYRTLLKIDIKGYQLANKIVDQICYEYKLNASSLTVGTTDSNDDWICHIHIEEKITKALETELKGYIKGFINAYRIYHL